MKKIQFETLAAAGAMESVCIYEVEEGYQLWAYPESSPDFRADFESCIFKTAKGETRIWSSLDVLVKFVRSMGYRGLITLDTADRKKLGD
jgi:hypothetical protein